MCIRDRGYPVDGTVFFKDGASIDGFNTELYQGSLCMGEGTEMCIRDRWHTLFLPACLLAAALRLFCFCILRGYKIPSPGLPGWLALGLGGGYFLLRAWFSPRCV